MISSGWLDKMGMVRWSRLFICLIFIIIFAIASGCSKSSDTRSAVRGAESLGISGGITSPGSDVEISPGDSLTFGSAVTGGVEPYSYSWNFQGGNPIDSTSPSQSVSFDTKGTYTVSLTITDDNQNKLTDTVKVTVTDSPKLISSITSPSVALSINSGETVSFSGLATGGSGGYAYTWVFSGGSPSTSSNQNPSSIKFNNAGTYSAQLTVKDSNGNTASDSVSISVLAEGATALTALISTPISDLTINEGDKINFSGQASGGSGSYSYSWDIPGGSTRTSTSTTISDVTFSTADTYTVTFQVRDSNGTTASDTVKITVSATGTATLTANITSPSSNPTITEGDSISFAGQATGGSGSNSYSWDIPGGSPSTSTSEDPGSVTFSTAGTYTVRFTVTDSSNTTASDTVTVTVNSATATLSADIASPASNQTITEGDSISFAGQTSGGSGGNSYSWDIPGGTPSSSAVEDPGSVTFSTAGTYTVRFTVTDSSSTTASDSVTITVNSASVAGLNANIASPASNQTITEGDSISFAGQTSGGSGGNSYSWDIPGGTPSSSAVEDPGSVTFSSAGNYTVTFTVIDNSNTKASDTVTVTVISSSYTAKITSPAADITVTSDATAGGGAGSGEKVDFKGIGSGGSTPYEYAWDIPGGSTRTSSTQAVNDVTFAAAGTYTVTFTVTDSLGNTATDTVIITAN